MIAKLRHWMDGPSASQFIPNEWEARFLGGLLAGVLLAMAILRLADVVAGWCAR